MVVPGTPVPVARVAAAGAVIVSSPVVTAKVTIVSGSPPAGAFEAGGFAVTAADAAVGISTAPRTATALQMPRIDFNINPPVRPGVPVSPVSDGCRLFEALTISITQSVHEETICRYT